MGKRIFALFVALLLVGLNCGCFHARKELLDETNSIFSSFDNKPGIAGIYFESYISFYDHELNVKDLPHKGKDSYVIAAYNNEIYFRTYEEIITKKGFFKDEYYRIEHIYKCDYYGENLSEVFTITTEDGMGCFYSDHTPGIIYIQRREGSSREYIIEAYEIKTGEFETICKGVKYDDYIENLYGDEARKAEIEGKLTEEASKEMLMASEEGRAFLKYNSSLKAPSI